MPLHVYRADDPTKGCDTCAHAFEVLQRVRARRLKSCPECGGPVTKQVASVNAAFPQGASELRSLGFARLEKRSDGSYENVSAQEGHQRVGSLESFGKDLSRGRKPILSD
jgi:putative FmdB family regulatory protein